jgi:hypothetical protein
MGLTPLDPDLLTLSNKGRAALHHRREAQAYDFSKNGADIPRPTMRNSFVLVQWHGESSVRETSLMI